jgi:ribosomal protein S18 acetylase RimI-like enzyme
LPKLGLSPLFLVLDAKKGKRMPSFDITLHQKRPIHPRVVRELYATVGWWPERQEQELARVLDSDLAIGAWDGDRLVGFARVISDGRFHAYIDDVLIHPDYQRAGLGSLLLTELLTSLRHIETITLFCQPELVSFYEKQGFRAYQSQIILHRKGNSKDQL